MKRSSTAAGTAAPVVSLVIYAKDKAALARFYAGLLSLRETEADDGFTLLAGSGIELTVVAMPEALAAGIEIAQPPAVREGTPLKFSFLVASLEQAVARASAAGGWFQAPEKAWSWRGMRHLDGHDPEGNVLQLRSTLAT